MEMKSGKQKSTVLNRLIKSFNNEMQEYIWTLSMDSTKAYPTQFITTTKWSDHSLDVWYFIWYFDNFT